MSTIAPKRQHRTHTVHGVHRDIMTLPIGSGEQRALPCVVDHGPLRSAGAGRVAKGNPLKRHYSLWRELEIFDGRRISLNRAAVLLLALRLPHRTEPSRMFDLGFQKSLGNLGIALLRTTRKAALELIYAIATTRL